MGIQAYQYFLNDVNSSIYCNNYFSQRTTIDMLRLLFLIRRIAYLTINVGAGFYQLIDLLVSHLLQSFFFGFLCRMLQLKYIDYVLFFHAMPPLMLIAVHAFLFFFYSILQFRGPPVRIFFTIFS